MVTVDFDVLPAASDAREAVAPGAPQVHTDIPNNVALVVPTSYGDVEAAFARAAHVFEEEIWAHRGGGMAMEPRAVLASHDPATDMLTVWSSTQTPHLGRRTLADLLGARSRSHPHDRARRRRRLRTESAVLCRGGRDSGSGDEARPSGEMAGGSPRAFPVRDPGARPVLEGRGRGRCGWQAARVPRQHAARHRRVHALGHRHALHRRGDGARALCDAGLHGSTSRSRSPTRCRPRRCAAPAGRRRCSSWSG